MMLYFGDILPFLQDNDLSPAYRKKALGILNDQQKNVLLQIELAVVVDAGEPFVKATYKLEGDGLLVFECYEVLVTVKAAIEASHFPNTQAVIHRLAGNSTTAVQQQLMAYAKLCVEPGQKYFVQKFTEELSGSVAAFKAARLFVPSKINEMHTDCTVVDSLQAFPFLSSPLVLTSLKQELPTYLAKAADTSDEVEPLTWWKKHSVHLPNWSSAARKVALVQPSSAAAERVFSILNSTFGAQQEQSLQDYIESSLMLQYNKH